MSWIFKEDYWIWMYLCMYVSISWALLFPDSWMPGIAPPHCFSLNPSQVACTDLLACSWHLQLKFQWSFNSNCTAYYASIWKHRDPLEFCFRLGCHQTTLRGLWKQIRPLSVCQYLVRKFSMAKRDEKNRNRKGISSMASIHSTILEPRLLGKMTYT